MNTLPNTKTANTNIAGTNTAHRPRSLLIISLCLLFLGLNGVIGGYLMLNDPHGAPMGMSVSVLEHTLFKDFTIPGLFLMFVWGSGSLLTLIGLWRRPQLPVVNELTRWTHEHWAWDFALLLGVGLLMWLTYQVFTLPEVAVIQYILAGLALLLIAIPLLPSMRAYYRVN